MNSTKTATPHCLLSGFYLKIELTLPLDFHTSLLHEDYSNLDLVYTNSLKTNGFLWSELKKYCIFNALDGIVAIREAPFDDEGIWHDDGSRVMGFSLSLNENPHSIIGGNLLLRERYIYPDSSDAGSTVFEPQPYGTLILFKTGHDSYEHRVTKVTKGKRIVLAGWCS